MTSDIHLESLLMFIAGILACAAVVFLLDSKRLVPALASHVSTRHVSLVELLDSLVKTEIITTKPENVDDANMIDPMIEKQIKEVLGDDQV